MPYQSNQLAPDRLTGFWLSLVYGLSALGAYQLYSIPLQWLGSALLVFPFSYMAFQGQKYAVEVWIPVVLLLLVCLVSLTGALFWGTAIDFPSLLPERASTDYPVFVALRYFQLVVFVMIFLFTYSYLERNGPDRLAATTVTIGALVALYALYVYAAGMLDLPEIPRNRMGTGGEEQYVVFSYAYHRALGSFREPSHLAEWLVLPFFLSYWKKTAYSRAVRVLIGFVVFLSGSLTGIVAIILGYVISALIVFSPGDALRRLVNLALIVTVCAVLVFLFAVPNSGEPANIVAVLAERLGPIVQGGGLAVSNRGYIYEFSAQHQIPLWGYGLGNANLLLSGYMGLDLVVSFLNLYLSMAYALGYPGVILLVAFFAFPLLALLRARRGKRVQLFALLGAYIAWMLVYLVHSEELSISFGILYGACIYYCHALQVRSRLYGEYAGNGEIVRVLAPGRREIPS